MQITPVADSVNRGYLVFVLKRHLLAIELFLDFQNLPTGFVVGF